MYVYVYISVASDCSTASFCGRFCRNNFLCASAALSPNMSIDFGQGFGKSLAMTVVSELGDKTFFTAAILAMQNPRRLVLSGCLTALIVMTIFSAVVGWASPNLISRKWSHHVTTLLFLGFGLWSLWDAVKGDVKAVDELKEVEAKLADDLKKHRRPFLTQFFSPIFLKAFSLTFFGEWGDKSQLATIGLAADENPFGVILGGIFGQAICTTLAVVGGMSLAKNVSERMVALSAGAIFTMFGIFSFLSTVE